MSCKFSWIAVVVLWPCLPSCQSGLGRVPPELVELYDLAAPAGTMEIELNRDGTIIECEADIDPAQLPPAIRAAAMARAPGGTVTGAEREVKASGRVWEVKMRHADRDWEFVVDDTGKILEVEKELRRDEAPAAVLQAADAALPGGTFKSVELIERTAEQEYHVKKMLAGASYKMVLTPEGRLKRKVREAVCEIEIPIK